jgi:prepilin-type N-terminal cleavage/methylation domain-containing protein
VNTMSRLRASSCRHRTDAQRLHAVLKPAFTLVELLVVVVILTVLASLSLAGLTGARQRAKIDKTRSTIRKIDAVMRPMYDSYRTRRVVTTGATRTATANTTLITKRGIMAREMPDSWDDIPSTKAVFDALPAAYQTSILRTYTNYRAANSTLSASDNASHECLYLIASRSGFEPDALELFRNDEVIDADGDGAKEFSDGWGSPIAFMRWAPGFSSPVQANVYSADAHDPLDPLHTDTTAYALVPLVYSPGADEVYGLITMSGTTTSGPKSGWAHLSLGAICALPVTGATDSSWNGKRAGEIDPSKPTAYRDNITNHDLSKK